MLRYIWIGPAAGMALLGSAGLVSAQQPPGGDRPARESPSGGKTLREPSPAQQAPPQERPRTDQFGTDRQKGGQRLDQDGPRTTDRPDRDRPRAVEHPDKSRPKGAERPEQDRPKTTDRPDKDRPKAAEQPPKGRSQGAEGPGQDRPSTARPDTDKDSPGRVRVSERERGEVGAKLRQTPAEKTRVQVNVNVGSRIPRSVRLRPLPAAIFALAPAYRGYSYLVLEDETIVIVDDRTFVVVDVIPPSTRTAGLSLSPDDMHFIFARVPRDEIADVRVRLALGAAIPRSVALLRFPPDILARIPEMERYRFVVARDDVAIVDPRDNAVVLVISE
jgi:hypothetical protein